MRVASDARMWARRHREVVEAGFEPTAAPQPVGRFCDDRRIDTVLSTLAARSSAMADNGRLVAETLSRTWTERLDTGYCSTEIRRVSDQYAILIESGLIDAFDIGAAAVARHYGAGFDIPSVDAGVRDSFGRFFATFVSQYFLYGRIRNAPLPLIGFDPRVAARIAQEGLLFVLGHELGHAMAGDHHFHGDRLWTDDDDVPDSLNRFAPEIEADAIAVQFSFGSLWAGEPLGQAEIELRLFAVRMSFAILQTVEQCCLTPRFARHLPAGRRWAGVASFLDRRLPSWLLDKHHEDWDALGPLFEFGRLLTVAPPKRSLATALRDNGWIDANTLLPDWEDIETAARQFRLSTPVLYAVLGLLCAELEFDDPEAAVLTSDAQRRAAVVAGSAVVDALVSSLPHWLAPVDDRPATTSVADVIEYLRKHQRWPEPFRSHPDIAPPVHLAAAAIARRFQGE